MCKPFRFTAVLWSQEGALYAAFQLGFVVDYGIDGDDCRSCSSCRANCPAAAQSRRYGAAKSGRAGAECGRAAVARSGKRYRQRCRCSHCRHRPQAQPSVCAQHQAQQRPDRRRGGGGRHRQAARHHGVRYGGANSGRPGRTVGRRSEPCAPPRPRQHLLHDDVQQPRNLYRRTFPPARSLPWKPSRHRLRTWSSRGLPAC